MAVILKSGDVFSGCRIISRCGRGAFGVTYLARNPLGEKIAIKVVSAPRNCERELKGLRRYMAVSGSRPSLLRIFHIGELEDGFYYTMEAADDCGNGLEYTPATLANLLKRSKGLPPERAIGILRQLLEGLETMHSAHLVHRDIKPDNIIFVNGIPKLSDPGLVAMEGETVSLAGTPGFIPPEILEGGGKMDQSADLYALGKVFYCMVTGLPPAQYPRLPAEMRIEVCRQLYPALMRMCNRNPGKRFGNVAEFLENLPRKLEKPTPFEKFRENFRNWRLCNRERFRLLVAGVLLLSLCALAVPGVLLHRAKVRREQIAAWKNEVAAFRRINRERPELTGFQIEVYTPEKLARYRKLDGELRKAADSGKWHEAARICRELHYFLGETAEQLMPVIPARAGSAKENQTAFGAARSYLATPLAAYAPPGKLADFRKRLDRFAKTIGLGPNSLLRSAVWENFQFYFAPMVFVPSGAVRMRHSGQTVRIPYHFWICRQEVLHEHFTLLLNIAPQRSVRPQTPVERVVWNDVLYYCFLLTRDFKAHGLLPPGYIVRPPTEAEWEYAANNAWMGKDDTPFEERAAFKKNSQGRTWPPGTRKAGRLGLYDIYGNVSEMVLPLEKPVWQNSVIARGGSFKSADEEKCQGRIPHLAYQNIPDTVGFRFVLAPGGMDYFDRHFFLSGPSQTRFRGKVYELIGANVTSFNIESARLFCQLLGGRLAELDTPAHLEHLRNALPLLKEWPAFAGGEVRDGVWRWPHSGKIIDHGKWAAPVARSAGAGLILKANSGWRTTEEKTLLLPLFLCEWDEKEYASRNARLKAGRKLPLELARFSRGGKTFVLLETNMLLCSAVRFCELLGGRPAVLDTPELLKEAVEKLEKFRDRKIVLGGYAKREKWYWLNGREITTPLRSDPVKPIPTRNKNCVTLQNGVLYDSHHGNLLLCEWPESSLSPL